jgi:hypothetical protein
MTLLNFDGRYKDNNFLKKSYLMASLVRVGIGMSASVYSFLDFVIDQGWNPPSNDSECDRQVLTMFGKFVREVWNG